MWGLAREQAVQERLLELQDWLRGLVAAATGVRAIKCPPGSSIGTG
jgi:hypothetical protein